MEEAAAKLRDLKEAQRVIAAEVDQLLAFLGEQHETGAMDHLTYEPGVYEFTGLKLTRSSRTSWKYTPAVKALQQAEQDSGAATSSVTEFWTTKLL